MDHLFIINPILNMFKYDPMLPRFFKFSIIFFQTNLFALICVLAFGYSSSLVTQNRGILLVGLLGMIMMLPIPYLKEIMKAKLVNTDSIKI